MKSEKINLMKTFLLLGGIIQQNESLKDRVAYKERIVFSTLRSYNPEWEKPSDWDGLTDEEKMERLTKVEQTLKETGDDTIK